MNKIYNLALTCLVFLIVGCTSPHYVNVERRHNYYQKHRFNSYTSPTWIPGRGIIMETHIYRLPKRSYTPRPLRDKH